MITESNINKIYDAIGTEEELTTRFLNGLGFNSRNLAQLIDKGILKRVKRGYYDVVNVESLYKYGISMIYKDKAVAHKYLRKCYEINSNYSELDSKLILIAIYEKDYFQVLEYLKLNNLKEKFMYTNHKFYLYLLSKLIELPDEYKKIVDKLKLSDIQFIPNEGDKNESKTKCRQEIRTLAFYNELSKASKIKIEGTLTDCDRIIDSLLKDILKIRVQKYNEILKNVKDKNYNSALEILEQMGSLCYYEQTIQSLLNTLETIIIQKQIPDKLDFKSTNVYEAISDQNYEWALYLSNKSHSRNIKYLKENDIMYLLLVDINDEIKRLENSCEDIKENNSVENLEKAQQSINPDFVVPALLYLLMLNDIERFMKYLPEYLNIIKKDKYQDIIEYLLELDTLNQDLCFTNTENFISHLTDDKVLNISEYIQCTMDSIINKKLNHARIYLKIINSYSKLGDKEISLEELAPVLTQMIQLEDLNKVENVASKQSAKKDITSNIDIENSKLTSDETIEELENDVSMVDNLPQGGMSDSIFLQKKFEQLEKEQGIIILKSMKKEKRDNIIELVKSYSDMVVFTIGISEPKRLVLRYKPKNHDFINVREEFRKANGLYAEHRYKEAKDIYLKLLLVGTPKEQVYSKLGLSYLKLNCIKLAIKYLTVATEMSLESGNDFDFTELIAKLKKEDNVEEIEVKPRVSMDIRSFNNDIDEYYGIDDIESIANLVANGLDVIEACQQFNLTTEQIGIVLLIFARECYSQNNFILGDAYLKRAERFQDKTTLINNLLDNVRRNKKFYSNRNQENHKRLILLPEY